VLYTSILKQDDKENILNLLLGFEDLMIVYCGLKHSYISKKFRDKEDFLKLFLHNYVFIDDYKAIDDQIMKFSIADFNEESDKYVDMIKDHLPDHLQAVTTGTIWFDIFNKSVNKGTGLKFIQNYFHISKEECMAFGDQMNDYELLLNSEESYAMSNGIEKLKAIAKHIAKSMKKMALFKFLEISLKIIKRCRKISTTFLLLIYILKFFNCLIII
ncbi:HAD hydrolase family protein, partial [Faecalibacillus intestinalis]|uniref:HAD hydrolase family protein n=1 Tax=Faecalibacillus intestinalis TaxID=1982626 RepID=UPI0039912942